MLDRHRIVGQRPLINASNISVGVVLRSKQRNPRHETNSSENEPENNYRDIPDDTQDFVHFDGGLGLTPMNNSPPIWLFGRHSYQ